MSRPTPYPIKRIVAAACSTAVALFMTACASDNTERAPTAAYRCDNGAKFTVRFDANSALVQWSDGRRATLPQQRAASGMWYAGRGYELRGKGNDATWTEPQAAPTECKAV